MLDVPRSVRLAAWGAAALRGQVPVAAAVAAVTGDDEPHSVAGEHGRDHPGDLTTLLDGLPRVATLRAVLPVPGDVLGLAGPAGLNLDALEAGEAVVVEPSGASRGLGLVPQVSEFGSPWEPGASVTWQVHPARARRVVGWGSLAEAESALREALATATAALARLDVARWREDAADQVAAVRDGALRSDAAPPTTDPRAVRVLASAARVRAIVALAGRDDGAAVSGWEMTRRAAALSEVDTVARRAMVAAVDRTLLPGR